jgi:phospholipid N-methyltransferase
MMVDRINFKTASSIVELGVGTGPITAAVAKRLHPDCRYLGVELDEELHAYAKKRFPQMNIVLADAADLPQLMEEHDMPAADAILTGLPIPSIPKEPQRRILHGAAAVMKEGAPWLQITALGGFLQYYRNRFDEVIRHWVPHFPYPTGGFYECRGVRDQVVGSAPK